FPPARLPLRRDPVHRAAQDREARPGSAAAGRPLDLVGQAHRPRGAAGVEGGQGAAETLRLRRRPAPAPLSPRTRRAMDSSSSDTVLPAPPADEVTGLPK